MKRWLIIDDDMDYQKIISRILRYKGINLEKCVDPTEAIEKIRKNGYDCILVDQKMPIMNGTELLNKVRDIIHGPVYILSGYRKQDIDKELIEKNIHIDGFISKADLSNKLRELVDS